MAKQLYEEALADVKKVKEVAQANAQQSILEALAPRLRDLLEKELLRESQDDESSDEDVVQDDDFKTKTSSVDVVDDTVNKSDKDYELSVESIETLVPLVNTVKTNSKYGIHEQQELELSIYRLKEEITPFLSAGDFVKRSLGFHDKINEMISKIEDTYQNVQAHVADPVKKSLYENKLETYFEKLNMLQGQSMFNKKSKNLSEQDVTMKLTGLPDELDLDSVNVDLITGDDEDVDASGEFDDSTDVEDSDGGEDVDLGGDEDSDGAEDEFDFSSEEDVEEGQDMDDDTVVEIDEGMLRKEISRMRKLREEKVGTGKSHEGPKHFGHKDPDESNVDQPGDMSEAEEGDLTADSLDELDSDEVDHDEPYLSDSGKKEQQEAMQLETLRKRAVFEINLRKSVKAKATSLKQEASKARGSKLNSIKQQYSVIAQKFNESLARSAKIGKMLTETKSSQQRLSQKDQSSVVAETNASLRAKLAETNLINAKLVYTNKLLQNEALNPRQKAQIIEQLDSTATLREAKLVYMSLTNALARSTKSSVNESKDRKVLGSSSRVTRSATVVTEGIETDRWAKLAGIIK